MSNFVITFCGVAGSIRSCSNQGRTSSDNVGRSCFLVPTISGSCCTSLVCLNSDSRLDDDVATSSCRKLIVRYETYLLSDNIKRHSTIEKLNQ
jgi:hypothetical protein